MLEKISEVESDLIDQAKAGDRGAYGELVTRYYENVVGLVYRLCGDGQIAQDATQEAFIRAWLKLASYQPRGPFRNWVYRIAVNTALDILRQKPQESFEQGEGVLIMAEKSPGPEAALIEKEQLNFLQGAVKMLPEGARTVLVLREYGELSYDEIATVLEIPIGTVMSRLNYARTRLRDILHQYRLETEREYARSN